MFIPATLIACIAGFVVIYKMTDGFTKTEFNGRVMLASLVVTAAVLFILTGSIFPA